MPGSKRPELKVIGSARNPEYNIAKGSSHFTRTEDGRRLAPLSQLNTRPGRLLAEEKSSKYANYSGSKPLRRKSSTYDFRANSESRNEPTPQVHSGSQNCITCPDEGSVSKFPQAKEPEEHGYITVALQTSNQDRLIPHLPRNESSQPPDMTRGNSQERKLGRGSTGRSDIDLSLVCPECNQGDSTNTSALTMSISHICNICRRFVPSTDIRTSRSSPQDKHLPLESSGSPIPPSKFPSSPVCPTCLPIPGYLYQEYLQRFAQCAVCGHMTDITLVDIVENGGEITGVTDDTGKKIFGASKELQDWCVYIAYTARDVRRHGSMKLVAASISSNGSVMLRRSGAVRRTPTGSMESSLASRQPRLVPASEAPPGLQYHREINIDPIKESKTIPSNITATLEEPQAAIQLPSHSQSSKTDTSVTSLEYKKIKNRNPTTIHSVSPINRFYQQGHNSTLRSDSAILPSAAQHRSDINRTFTGISSKQAQQKSVLGLRRKKRSNFLRKSDEERGVL